MNTLANTGRQGTLVVLAGHGVYDSDRDCFYSEHPEDRPIYEAQLMYAFGHLRWRADASPLLVISGGPSKAQLALSESRSYLDLARKLALEIPANVVLEEFALTSVENLLFSLYAYHQHQAIFPKQIEVISWEFKRERFTRALEALSNWQAFGEKWAELAYFPVGDLAGSDSAAALRVEQGYINSLARGVEFYYANPKTQSVLRNRDVHSSRAAVRKEYGKYPLPF